MGLDIGSTTVKVILLDGLEVVHEKYCRHNADIQGELTALLDEVSGLFPGTAVRARVTGSGGLSVAGLLGLPFVQEVIAGTEAIRQYHPDTDVIIELGGEDAKITYLKPSPEQRMNGTCAGGTGAFIDQMATLLRTDAAGLNDLAARYDHLYPIASRCGVFAKSDLQPLMNEGAASEDLAASIFQSVATQTIAGLACGRPIRGQVVFLGGPLYFLPELRKAYERILAGAVTSFTTPQRAQLYVAIGAALLANGEAVELAAIAKRLRTGGRLALETARVRPLFVDEAERSVFLDRHRGASAAQIGIERASGPCFLGIDAGSTTIKAVLINDRKEIVFSSYAGNDGDPIGSAIAIVQRIYRELPAAATIARSCVTGYGEGLIKTALRADDGEIETMAHYRAAEHVCPGVSAVIDIGGQDMKYLRVSDGVIESISVNEACSSGCGSFLQTFAEALGLDVQAFSAAALAAASPVDLGSRCTVFMNSSVKQAQKEGASVGDISAGLSYSVIRNALYKVIKLRDSSQLGEKIVVQGGTFLNDAVLRAFELLIEREVVRPDIAGLMGAFGAALVARGRFGAGSSAGPGAGGDSPPDRRSGLLGAAELAGLRVDTELSTCRRCQNHCQRTISTFSTGERHISGNRCDRGADAGGAAPTGLARAEPAPPNLFDYKYRRLFGYRRLTAARAVRGDIGIPRALNMYENYPFWFTVLSRLGFRVVLSGRSSHRLFEQGMDSIPSENVCYPAKLVHGHIMNLIDRGVKVIFYPCVVYEQRQFAAADDHYNCPVVTSYPELIRTNVEQLSERKIRLINPFLNLANRRKLVERLVEVFADFGVSRAEAEASVAAGFAEDAAARADILAKGRETLRFLEETGTRGIVLAGRPYHVDPEVHHGIPELINGLGMAVLTEDSIIQPGALRRPIRVRDQWAYHSRLYEAAAVVAERADLELVQLNSFGCGLDAITSDQVQEILEARGGVYTALKIDEISNLGAARIRLRSLAAAVNERENRPPAEHAAALRRRASRSYTFERPLFTKRERAEHTLIAPQMSPIHFRLLESALQRGGYRVHVLEHASASDVEIGLKYVNNDACYPAVMVVGQLVNGFLTGEFDPDRCSVMISQTGGMCRATNYAALLRKALRDSGYGQVAVVAISAVGVEKHPGFALTPPLVHRAMQAVVLGDLLQTLLLRVRPYEAEPGSAQARYHHWNQVIREYFLESGFSPTLGRKVGYTWLVKHAVADFDALPLRDVLRRSRVGIVGEILVKFHPDANNHVVEVVEAEGCEAVLPGLAEFILESLPTGEWNYQHLGTEVRARQVKKILARIFELYRRPVRRALRATGGKFFVPGDIYEMAERASTVLSLGNQSGEGWLLTAEMLELIEHGVPNIICAQPFACLPNHVTGKGMIRELRRQHPQANIVAIDYDPGASEVNQLNRIKLMIATAHLRDGAVDAGTSGAGDGPETAEDERPAAPPSTAAVNAAACTVRSWSPPLR
ncbi:MAG: activase [Dactylosporangium sp.]|nr:activase [Dactylosporangium sp.]